MASCCGLRLSILVTAATVTGTLVTLVTPAPHCPSLPPGPGSGVRARHCAGWAQLLRSRRCSSAPLGGCGITDTGEAAAPGPASLQW